MAAFSAVSSRRDGGRHSLLLTSAAMCEEEQQRWRALVPILATQPVYYCGMEACLRGIRPCRDVFVSTRLLDQRWDAGTLGERSELSDLVPWALANPAAVYRYERGDTTEFGFHAKPHRRYDENGDVVQPDADEVFTVFVTTRLTVRNWYWQPSDKVQTHLPSFYRLGRKVA